MPMKMGVVTGWVCISWAYHRLLIPMKRGVVTGRASVMKVLQLLMPMKIGVVTGIKT